MPDRPIVPIASLHLKIIFIERERGHIAPLWAQRIGVAEGERVARLVHEELEGQWLPAVWIRDGWVARELREQWLVDWFVVEVFVIILLVGPVGETELDDRGGDSVAERGGAITLNALVIAVISEMSHELGVFGQYDDCGRRITESVTQQTEHREADRFVAGGFDIVGTELLVMEDLVSLRVVGCPCVPHRGAGVVQVASVDRRACEVLADRFEQGIVPLASDRMRYIALWSLVAPEPGVANHVASLRLLADVRVWVIVFGNRILERSGV